MDIEFLIDVYKKHAKDNNLKPEYHRTHISLLMSKISCLLEWCSESKNEETDRYSNLIYNASILYDRLEEIAGEYVDSSQIHKIKGEEPNLLIKNLVDIFIYLLIYISGNNWSDSFLKELNERALKDSIKTSAGSRFNNRRLSDKF